MIIQLDPELAQRLLDGMIDACELADRAGDEGSARGFEDLADRLRAADETWWGPPHEVVARMIAAAGDDEDFADALRDLVIEPTDQARETHGDLATAVSMLEASAFGQPAMKLAGVRTTLEDREYLTGLCLSLSLCPVHRIDYAICFDDRDPECAQVRAVHPGHDT